MGAAEVLLSTLRNDDMSAPSNGTAPPAATPAKPPTKELPPQD
jgi:hypothetical protein